MSSEKWRRFGAEKTIISRQELQIQEESCIVNLVEWFQAKELEEKRIFEGKLGYVVLYVMILFTKIHVRQTSCKLACIMFQCNAGKKNCS